MVHGGRVEHTGIAQTTDQTKVDKYTYIYLPWTRLQTTKPILN